MGTLLIVLLLIVVGIPLFLAFAADRASRPDIELTNGYRLQWLNGDRGGQGYTVVRSDGQKLSWQRLPRSEGLESIEVAGESHRKKAVQDPAFAPGNSVRLIPEPDNEYDPNALGIWSDDRRLQCGYVPATEAKRIGKKLVRGDIERAIVIWETEKNGERVSLRLLLLGSAQAS